MKVYVYSHRGSVLTLCHEDIRCVLHQGMNKLDADAWAKVKEHDSVKKLLETKAIEEKGEVKEVAKAPVKAVADQAIVADESADESSDEE